MTSAKILFVDDDSRILEGIENMFFDAPDEWQLEFATSGTEAIDFLDADGFDVLVTDMKMPGMDGAELLAIARERFPSVVRVVLSGHTDQVEAQRAMPIVHEFLSKPCDPETLTKTLEQALELTHHFSLAARAAMGGLVCLPARPKIYPRLAAMLEGDAGADEVAEVVESEMGLAAKVLHIANTSFYSPRTTISRVRDAVVLLGVKATTNLALSMEAFGSVSGQDCKSVEALHEHSLLVAHVAQKLLPASLRPDAMLGGMLHELGRLLICSNFPVEDRTIADLVRTQGLAIDEAERSVLGFDHAEVGAYLLRLWHLSEETARGLELHHKLGFPERDPIDLALFASDYTFHEPEPCARDERLSDEERDMVERSRSLLEEVAA